MPKEKRGKGAWSNYGLALGLLIIAVIALISAIASIGDVQFVPRGM